MDEEKYIGITDVKKYIELAQDFLENGDAYNSKARQFATSTIDLAEAILDLNEQGVI